MNIIRERGGWYFVTSDGRLYGPFSEPFHITDCWDAPIDESSTEFLVEFPTGGGLDVIITSEYEYYFPYHGRSEFEDLPF